ncbi:MAG: hypothetical protein RIS47_1980 [Bacteroidota bacterium]
MKTGDTKNTSLQIGSATKKQLSKAQITLNKLISDI